jgi:CRISPR/Cas system endoribonuclease Cas6 (RAMP superfamily)
VYSNGSEPMQQYPAYQHQQMNYPQYPNQQPVYYSNLHSWFDYNNGMWVKGAIVGAAAAFLLSNKTVQKTLAKGMIGVWATLQGGVEEFKEQIRDIQAENYEE